MGRPRKLKLDESEMVDTVDQDVAEDTTPEPAEDGPAEQPAPTAANTNLNIPAQVLADAIVTATELTSGRARKVPFGKQQIRSPFNPTGKRNRKLKQRVYQTGIRVNVKTLTDEEIALLNSGKIQPGRYIDRLVTVTVRDDQEGEPSLLIDYNCKTADQRMNLAAKLGRGGGKEGFENMLRLIVKEIEENAASAKARRRQEVQEAMTD